MRDELSPVLKIHLNPDKPNFFTLYIILSLIKDKTPFGDVIPARQEPPQWRAIKTPPISVRRGVKTSKSVKPDPRRPVKMFIRQKQTRSLSELLF